MKVYHREKDECIDQEIRKDGQQVRCPEAAETSLCIGAN